MKLADLIAGAIERFLVSEASNYVDSMYSAAHQVVATHVTDYDMLPALLRELDQADVHTDQFVDVEPTEEGASMLHPVRHLIAQGVAQLALIRIRSESN